MPKILAIDDNPDNLVVVTALLRHFLPGCAVATAQSGAEGIEMARAESPDVILSDLRMPGIDGFEVCRQLKSDPETRRIPVIMLTAVQTDSESRVRGLELGADAFLTKPIKETELVAQVNVALRIKRAEDALRHERTLLEKKVEERTRALRENEQRIRLALEGTDQGLWDWDVSTGDIRFDDNWPTVLGYSNTDIGFTFDWLKQRVHPDNLPAFRKALGDYLEGREKYYELEYRVRSRAGDWLWIWARGVCVEYDEGGNPLRFIGTNRDITARKKAERELQKAHDELEVKVVERTRELHESNLKLEREIVERERTQQELRHQQAQLVHAGRLASLGEMATGVAHELNQPLAIIRLYAESFLIQKGMGGAELAETAESIIRLVDRAANIVRHMRSFSRARPTEKRRIDPVTPAESALEFFREQFRNHAIEIRTEYGEDLPRIVTDAQLVEQALINFLSNARFAVEERGRSGDDRYRKAVTVRIRHDRDEGAVVFEVADNGIGMGPEEMEKCFDPFYTTKDVGQGTGIGLSIVNGIARELGGRAECESRPEAGTAMRLVLPSSEEEGGDAR